MTGSIGDTWRKVKENQLDILNSDIGKMEIAPRKAWITEAMIKKMEERRIWNAFGRDMRGNNGQI